MIALQSGLFMKAELLALMYLILFGACLSKVDMNKDSNSPQFTQFIPLLFISW